MGCFDVLGQINYLAVLVCTAIAMVLGALWYSPVLFGNAWMKGVGLKPEDINKGSSAKAMIISTINSFIAAVVLAAIIVMTNTTTFGFGLHLGALVAVAFIATVLLTNSLYEQRSMKTWLINSAYHFVYFAINGGILAIWK